MKIAKFEFSLFGINTYVVYDPEERKAAVVDPGMMLDEERDAMVKFLEREQLELTHVIDTHIHVDHAIGVQFLKDRYNVKFFAHKDDQFLGERLLQQARNFGVPLDVEEVVIDHYLTAGEKIAIGSGELTVLHVPGHSPGSVALYDAAGGFVITGDALFQGSVGRADLPGGNATQLINSIKTQLLALPDDTVVYPGHGPATTIGRERAANPFLRENSPYRLR